MSPNVGTLHAREGPTARPSLQDGTCGDTQHSEEGATLHIAIRRVVARRGKPSTVARGDNDGGDTLDGQAATRPGAPSLSVRLLPSGFPLREQFAEHAEQLATGGQLPLAEEDELLGGDLAPVSTWRGTNGRSRSGQREPAASTQREPSTAQVGPSRLARSCTEPMSTVRGPFRDSKSVVGDVGVYVGISPTLERDGLS